MNRNEFQKSEKISFYKWSWRVKWPLRKKQKAISIGLGDNDETTKMGHTPSAFCLDQQLKLPTRIEGALTFRLFKSSTKIG